MTPLNKFISGNFKPMKNWNLRNKNCSSHSNLIQNVRTMLNIISGNNIITMLKEVLKSKEKTEINFKYKEVLKELSIPYRNMKPKERYKLISAFRKAKISIQEVKELGYKPSSFLWKSCINEKKAQVWKKTY